MITWVELVYDLKELCKLENGGGSEIEFEYRGVPYIIICYKDWCSLAIVPGFQNEREYIEKTYNSIEELGKAKDFGFSVEEEWDCIENLVCNPDFEDVPLQVIIDAYNAAWNKRRK